MAADQAERTREQRLRRAAARQGYKLVKSPRRDPRARDFGDWMVVDIDTNAIVAGEIGRVRFSLDDVENYLMGEDR